MSINLRGAGQVDPHGTATVLAGDLKAVNSVEKPTNVAPQEETIVNAAAAFQRTFAPHSFTVLRLQAAPR